MAGIVVALLGASHGAGEIAGAVSGVNGLLRHRIAAADGGVKDGVDEVKLAGHQRRRIDGRHDGGGGSAGDHGHGRDADRGDGEMHVVVEWPDDSVSVGRCVCVCGVSCRM